MKSNFLKLVFLADTTNQTHEIGDNNDSGPSEKRNILSKRQSSRVKKNNNKLCRRWWQSDPEDSGTEYDKVVVLGS